MLRVLHWEEDQLVVFEIQVVLTAMLNARRSMDAHRTYNQFRCFVEVFALLGIDPELGRIENERTSNDSATLNAKVEQLTADNSKLWAETVELKAENIELKSYAAEIADLRAEIAQLKAVQPPLITNSALLVTALVGAVLLFRR